MLLEEAFDMMPPTTLSSQYKSPKLKITTWATTITIVKFIGAEELHPILGGGREGTRADKKFMD